VEAGTALRASLYLGGAVATAAGLHTVAAGARSIPGEKQQASPPLESELRYYGAFYAAYGLALLRLAPRAEQEPATVRAAAGVLLVAGLARAGGWLAAGPPHPAQRVLLAIELGAPVAIASLVQRPNSRSREPFAAGR
jgi:hypothetical protein